jgi:hypothetical protein
MGSPGAVALGRAASSAEPPHPTDDDARLIVCARALIGSAHWTTDESRRFWRHELSCGILACSILAARESNELEVRRRHGTGFAIDPVAEP